MDVTLSYTVNSIPVQTVYSNSKANPDFNRSVINLVLESGITNYDTLNNDMSNSPTNIEIEFTSMGEARTYSNLTLSACNYTKILNVSSSPTTTYQMQITFDYSS